MSTSQKNARHQILRTLERIFVDRKIARDDPWLVGVSGGRDSVALLAALRLFGQSNLQICHLNHELRGEESQEDTRFVENLANRWGIPFHGEAMDVQKLADQEKTSLEEAARNVRQEFFAKIQRSTGAHGIFLAHHADDQAETVLFNLLRGGSPGGVSGMTSDTWFSEGLRICRPLLSVRRAVLSQFLEEEGLEYREDSSNCSARHTRNRLRNEALPLLQEIMGRDITPALVRFAEIAEAEESLLHQLTVGSRLVDLDPLPVRLVQEQPVALQRRILVEWLKRHDIFDLDFQKIEQARALLDPNSGPAKINLTGNQALRRREMHLHIERQ